MRYRGTLLTLEQEDFANQIISGSNVKLQAPAGGGKTFSLLAGARRLSGNGLNISFNKSIALNASKKFNSNIQCRTGHSLAFGYVGRIYIKRLQKITGSTLANSFNIGKISLFNTPATKGYYILETLRHFCYSSDLEINTYHVPKLQIITKPEIYEKLKENLVYHTKNVWNEMIKLSSQMPITHDFYLKLWALSKPDLRKDFIFFDEVQDANPVMLDIIMNQSCQKIFAGDAYQQIYAWRGAINALQKVDFKSYFLTKSFRFGQAIADVANDIINSYARPENRIPRILGNEDKAAEVVTSYQYCPDAIICRTNSGVITNMISCINQNYKVHILGGVNGMISLIRGIDELKYSDKSYHPELRLFNSYDEFMEYIDSPMGGSLKSLMNILKKYKSDELIKKLNSTWEDETQADVIITTVHKAKGMEWPVVRLGNDFKYPDIGEMIPQEEVNILYVAATRALNILDISHCAALREESLDIGRNNWNLDECYKY